MRKGWEYKKLGDLCDIYQPKTLATEHLVADGKYYVYGANGIIGRYNDYNHEQSEILLTCRGATCGTINISQPYSWINGNAMVIHRKSEDLSFDFLKYLMLSLDYSLIITGAAQPQITRQKIAPIIVKFPSLSVQQSIVSELDKINELIRLKKEQLKDYDNLAQSIFYEMFGDPVVNEKGWEVKKIGEVCLIERGGSPRPIKDYITEDEDGLNWIKIGDAQEGSIFINSTKEKIRKEGLKKTRMVHKGDFILSNSMSFGRPYIMGVDGCIHDGWLVLHDTNNTFNKLYLYYSLAHKSMYQQFKQMAVGGVVNNLNSEMVRRVLVLVPPLIVQQEFANRIELIEMQKKQIISTIQALETLLASRMQYWFD